MFFNYPILTKHKRINGATFPSFIGPNNIFFFNSF